MPGKVPQRHNQKKKGKSVQEKRAEKRAKKAGLTGSGLHLTGEGDQPPRGKNQANVELRPVMRREIDCDKWPEAGLDVSQKKTEPIEAAGACVRQGAFTRRHRHECECRRDSAFGLAVQPTASKFQC